MLSSLKINGSAVDKAETYTFNSVNSNQTIEAIFEKEFTISDIPVGAYISYTPGTNITISYTGGTYTPSTYTLGWKVFKNNNGFPYSDALYTSDETTI